MIERSHLHILLALEEKGTLTEAANALCLSQSALSHQIRYLEKKLGVRLWQKEGRLLRLTQAGERLLLLAKQVIPVFEQTEETLKALSAGKQGFLRIGVECYPCSKWLNSVVGDFLEELPAVEIDIVQKFQFSGLEGLLNHHIDVLVTPDLEQKAQIHYEPVADYDLVALIARQHPLATRKWVNAEALSQETILSFPIPREKMDIMTQFFNPANISPANIKELESIDLMIQMVSLNRGVCVLPEWLADYYIQRASPNPPITKLTLGKSGIHKQLYLALHQQDRTIPYIQKFIQTGKKVADHLF